MLKILKLLLPALIPSWRFFDIIAPSPRIQFTLLNAAHDTPSEWHEFRPRPARVSFGRMLRRMLWNPVWNESLFMVSCAERIIEQPTPHSEMEIIKRICAELSPAGAASLDSRFVQFRLQLIRREGEQLVQSDAYLSQVWPLTDSDIREDVDGAG